MTPLQSSTNIEQVSARSESEEQGEHGPRVHEPNRSRYGQTAKKAALWDVGVRLTIQVILLLSSIVLARLLTPSDFGIAAAARFFVTLATRLTQLGLNASIVRMKIVRDEHLSSVFVVNIVLSVVAFATLWLASPYVGRALGSYEVGRLLPLSAAVFLITPFGTVAGAMLARNLRYRTSSLLVLSDMISGTLVSLGMAWYGFGYWSLVGGALVGIAVSTAIKMWVTPWRFSVRFSAAAFREILSFGLGVQSKRLLVFSMSNLDNLIVGRFLGMANLGLYDKAFGLMNHATDRMPVDVSLMRIFSIIRDDRDRFRAALQKGLQAVSLLMVPLLVFCGVTADRLILVLYGPQWVGAIAPFRMLAVVGIIRAVSRPVDAANEAQGYVWLQALYLLGSLVLLVGGVAVGAQWGLVAVAVGVLIATATHSMLSWHLLVRHTKVTWTDLAAGLWPSFATAGILGAGLLTVNWGLRQLSVDEPAKLFIGDIVTAAVVYPSLLLWTPFRSVRTIVRDTVDDIAPWVRRIAPVGVLRNADRIG